MVNLLKVECFKRLSRCFTLLELLIGMGLAVMLLSTLSYFYLQVEMLNTEAERTQKESFELRHVENRLAKILPYTLSERELKKHFYFFTSQGEGMFKNPSLLFTFYNGVKLSSPFANDVLGRLYLDDEKKQLCLATWPSPKRWENGVTPPMAKEVLLDDVESLSFQFYVAPKRDRSKVVEQKKTAQERQGEEAERRTQELRDQRDQRKKNLGKQQQPAPTPVTETNPVETLGGSGSEEAEHEPQGPWSSEWRHDYHHLPAIIRVHVTRKVQDKTRLITFAFPLSYSQKVIVYEENL
jgi:hypothetical protein